MKTAAVIAEYNPFHNGHKYHIEETRKQTGADYIIAVMSGDFVQRGEPAFADKYLRAEMALCGGADLVLELPAAFACGSAEYFARGGVSLADALGVVDHLSFGCESCDPGNGELLRLCSFVLMGEPEGYRTLLNSGLKNGLSYPAAREAALSAYLGKDLSFLRQPNNILALEYQKALSSLGSKILPLPVARCGSGYHDTELGGGYASASAVRSALLSCCTGGSSRHVPGDQENVPEHQDCASRKWGCPPEDPECTSRKWGCPPPDRRYASSDEIGHILTETIPAGSADLLASYLEKYPPVTSGDLSLLLHAIVLRAGSPSDFMKYYDMDESLAHRIFSLRDRFTDFESFCSLLKTKNTTMLHIRRALLHMILDITDASVSKDVMYTRILAMKKSAAPLLHEIKLHSRLPVISKMADAADIIRGYEGYTEHGKKTALIQLQQTTYASNLYQAVLSGRAHTPWRHENTRQFIIR